MSEGGKWSRRHWCYVNPETDTVEPPIPSVCTGCGLEKNDNGAWDDEGWFCDPCTAVGDELAKEIEETERELRDWGKL